PAPPTTAPSTLSLHDALPIYREADEEQEPAADRPPGVDRPVRLAQDVGPLVEQRREGGPGQGVHGDRRADRPQRERDLVADAFRDRKSTRLNSSHRTISYAVF